MKKWVVIFGIIIISFVIAYFIDQYYIEGKGIGFILEQL